MRWGMGLIAGLGLQIGRMGPGGGRSLCSNVLDCRFDAFAVVAGQYSKIRGQV